MFSLRLHAPPAAKDELIAELWEAGTAGIVDEEGAIRAFFEHSADPAALSARFTPFHPELREEPVVDWAEATRDAWPPLEIGEHFFLVTPWCTDPAPPGRLRLIINPGMACGTGRHPATQLALEALERYVHPGDRVADIGTGSGILAAAASLLGARQVIACDIDLASVQVAAERLQTPVFAGSASAIRSGWAQVVIANIDSAAIEGLRAEFERIRTPQSTLILTGFPHWDKPEGYHPREALRRDEWVSWIC